MRRYLRFNLRTLLVLITAACVWMGYIAHNCRNQQKACHLIQAIGGNVAWKTTSPEWLASLLGYDPFGYVWEVSFIDTPIRGDDLKALSDLKRLEQINIAQNATFTGEGLRHLAGLNNLRQIYLYEVPVTDEGLQELPELPALEKLYVLATRITDKCLPFVEDLSQLSEIQLGGSEPLTKSAVNELDMRMPACQVSWSGQGYSEDR